MKMSQFPLDPLYKNVYLKQTVKFDTPMRTELVNCERLIARDDSRCLVNDISVIKDLVQIEGVNAINGKQLAVNQPLKRVVRVGQWSEHHSIRQYLWKVLGERIKKSHSDPFVPAILIAESEQNAALHRRKSRMIQAMKQKMAEDEEKEDQPEATQILSATREQLQSSHKLPSFVDPNCARYFYLNSEGRDAVTRVLWALQESNPQITYAPLLYPLVAILLHYHSEKEAFIICSYLLGRDEQFLSTTRGSHLRDCFVFIKLTAKFGFWFFSRRKIHHLTNEARRKLKSEGHVDDILGDWLHWLLVGLPFNTLVRLIDCFLVEGKKFLFRASLAILLLYSTRNPSTRDLSDEAVLKTCEKLTPDELLLNAIQIKNLSRKIIHKQYGKCESVQLIGPPRMHGGSTSSGSGSEGSFSLGSSNTSTPSKYSGILAANGAAQANGCQNYNDLLANVILSNRIAPLDFTSSILDWRLLDMVWDEIPERVTIMEPKVIFCSDVHGNSLQTFYQLASNYEVTLLVVQTVDDEVYGAFCCFQWSTRSQEYSHSAKKKAPKDSNAQPFGLGDSFLFSLLPQTQFHHTGHYKSQLQNGPTSQVDTDPGHVSSANQVLVSATPKAIQIQISGIGLYLDDNLSRGTFSNSNDISANRDFECLTIEVIAFT